MQPPRPAHATPTASPRRCTSPPAALTPLQRRPHVAAGPPRAALTLPPRRCTPLSHLPHTAPGVPHTAVHPPPAAARRCIAPHTAAASPPTDTHICRHPSTTLSVVLPQAADFRQVSKSQQAADFPHAPPGRGAGVERGVAGRLEGWCGGPGGGGWEMGGR